MTVTRRTMLKSTAAVSAGFAGLSLLGACGGKKTVNLYGPVIEDPKQILDLPEGFLYRIISRTGDPLSDGWITPGAPDGMAAMATDDKDIVRLMRNHELVRGHLEAENNSPKKTVSAFNADNTPNRDAVYDVHDDGTPFPGGVSSVDVHLKTLKTSNAQMRLAGTAFNCAGGPTPWGSWLTCEESFHDAGKDAERNHGYVFEVPAAGSGLTQPVPLTALGRFSHEAAAVNPDTGVVYMTEDNKPACFYRFVPNTPYDLSKGGRLQALGIVGAPGRSLRNANGEAPVDVRSRFDVTWIDVPNVSPSEDRMAKDSIAEGAAVFTRLEGCWNGDDGVYFVSTDGGLIGSGQIWRYVPSPYEGLPHENTAAGTLELFSEPNDKSVSHKIDNITIAPWGGILVCEDGSGPNRMHFVTQSGAIVPFACHSRRYKGHHSELTGACFSPDGSTLFVNIQRPGITLAIQGPFQKMSET